jgi:hypothetical protein
VVKVQLLGNRRARAVVDPPIAALSFTSVTAFCREKHAHVQRCSPFAVPAHRPGDPSAVKRWCREFGVTAAQLAEAVQAVGGDAAAVREHLLNQGASAGAR